jgi:hypothetical protein
MSIRAIVALANQTARMMANGYIRDAVESGPLTEERPQKRGQRETSGHYYCLKIGTEFLNSDMGRH